MITTNTYYWKVGLFSFIGLLLFILTIYILGFNQNLFRSSFVLYARFSNVSGLKQGSTVRLSGINVGTVARIEFVSDSLVLVKLFIDKDIQPYLKADAIAAISSDGLVGDKVLEIVSGNSKSQEIKNNDTIASIAPIQWETLLKSVLKSTQNAEVITGEWRTFSQHLNQDKGLIYQLIRSEAFATSVHNTVNNLEQSSHELALFTPALNNKHGTLNQLLNNAAWSDQVRQTLNHLQSTSHQLDIFSMTLNQQNGLLYHVMTNDSLRIKIDHTIDELDKTASALHVFSNRMNQPNTVLYKITNDPKTAQQLDSIVRHIDQGVQEFRNLEEAAKASIIFRSYFKKKQSN